MSIRASLLLLLCLCLLWRAPVAQGKRLGVCVTGQLLRGELSNKIERFLEPSCRLFDQVMVVLVLANDTMVFANEAKFAEVGPLLHMEKTMKRLRSISCVTRVSINKRPQVAKPLLQKPYINAGNKFPKNDERRIVRGTSHVRQWQANYRCYLEFQKSGNFDMYVRMREDFIFQEPWVPPAEWLKEPGIHVPVCLAWHGYNDKFAAIVGKRHASTYFVSLLADYYTEYGTIAWFAEQDGFAIQNPESYLRAVLSRHSCTVHLECPEVIPASGARPFANGTYCYLGKDMDGRVKYRDTPPPLNGGKSCYAAGENGRANACIHEKHVEEVRSMLCDPDDPLANNPGDPKPKPRPTPAPVSEESESESSEEVVVKKKKKKKKNKE